MQDYYTILEIPPTATKAEIKHAYRRLVRKYHPDLNQQTLDKHIKLLNEAYEVLSNPPKRATYDTLRTQEKQRLKAAQEEAQQPKQPQVKQATKMTWIEGVFGFVKELRKGLREE